MEYVRGRSLGELISAGLSTKRAASIGALVARAIDAAHAAGVLHRDIKPDNVMVDDGGNVKVVDFGIAHRLSGSSPTERSPDSSAIGTFADTLPLAVQSATMETNTILGTPGYMAPELLIGKSASSASDVYALGVLLFEAISGGLPYSGPELLEVLGRVVDPKSKPPTLTEAAGSGPAISELVDSMLAHNPDMRPTLREVAPMLLEVAAQSGNSKRADLLDDQGPASSAAARTIPRTLLRPRRGAWVVLAAAVGLAALVMAAVALSFNSLCYGGAHKSAFDRQSNQAG